MGNSIMIAGVLGDNSAFDRSYGPGALVGLPSTLNRRNYFMTATVTEDAELVMIGRGRRWASRSATTVPPKAVFETARKPEERGQANNHGYCARWNK
jgi:hypothetical protein